MKRKRIWLNPLLVLLLVLSSVLPYVAPAVPVEATASEVAVTVGDVIGKTGDIVEVPVSISSPVENIGYYSIVLNYDSSKLELVKNADDEPVVTNNREEVNGTFVAVDMAMDIEGPLWVSWSGDSSEDWLTTAGNIFTVSFKVLASESGRTNVLIDEMLGLNQFSKNGDNVDGTDIDLSAVDFTNGSVEVNTVAWTAGEVSAPASGTVSVPVSFSGLTKDMGAYDAKLAYDSTKLEAVSVTPVHGDDSDTCGPASAEGCFASNIDNAGEVVAVWADSSGGDRPLTSAYTDEVFTVEFKVKSGVNNVDDELAVSFDEAGSSSTDLDGYPITPNYIDGKITVIQGITVTFDSNDGSTVDSVEVAENSLVTKPVDPTRTGYTFAGWYEDADLTEEWDFAADTITAAATLYAKWTPETYTITFNSNSGSAVTDTTASYAGLITEPTDPTRTGYTFEGWYGDAGLTEEWDFTEDKVTGATTLYAKWEAVTYTVTYDANGATGGTIPVDGSSPYEEGDTAAVEGNSGSLEKTGYTFAGWNTAADGSGDDYAPDSTLTVGTADVVLYAKWESETYTITFDSNGGTSVSSSTASYDELVTEPTAPTRTGYTFGGWYGEAGLTEEWDFTEDKVTGAATLYAKWESETYTITFDSNGGTSVSSSTVSYDELVTEPADPTRTGYTFAGWYEDAGLTEEWDFAADTITAAATLYAKWTPETYTITFNSNSGSAVTDTTASYDGLITEPTDPTRIGYTFEGWYGDAGLTEEWDFTEDKVTGATTLYAKWEIKTYTVTYNTDGGTVINQATVNHGDPVVKPLSDPTKTGYTFEGWYKDASFTTAFDFTNEVITANTDIFAKWESTATEVTVTVGSASGMPGEQVEIPVSIDTPLTPIDNYGLTIEYDDSKLTYIGAVNKQSSASFLDVDIPAFGLMVGDDYDTLLSTAGDLFVLIFEIDGSAQPGDVINVSVSSDDSAVKDDDGKALRTSLTGGTVTVEQGYSVTYDANGATGGTIPVDGSSPYEEGDTSTVEGNSGSLEKTGYTFAGWNTAADGSGTDYALDSTLTIGTADVVLYAKWESETYTITFDSNGGTSVSSSTVSYDELVTEPTAPTRTGYTFAGWYKDAGLTEEWDFKEDKVTGATTLYAKWESETYTITFDSNGGTSVSSSTVSYDELVTEPTASTRTGYTFGGWYGDAGLTEEWDFTEDKITGVTTLYAKWESETYTITFDSNGGTSVSSSTVSYDELVTEPTAPTKTGYTFEGWYGDAGLTEEWDFTEDKVTSAATLYAKWEAVTYTVTYDANSATGGTIPVDGSSPYEEGDTATVAGNSGSLEKTGYTFAGWNTAADGSGDDYAAGSDLPVGPADVVLYAQWTDIPTYIVTYDDNGNTGGTVPVDTASYNAGAGAVVLDNIGSLVKNGYTFAGWNTAADGTGTNYTAGSTLTIGAANVTLYAQWTPITYEVTFDTGEGTAISSQTVAYNDKAAEPTDPPTWEDNTFLGWYEGAELTEPFNFDQVITDDTVIYAKWELPSGQYLVTFESNDGDTVQSVSVEEGSLLSKPAPDPQKTGHTFEGWYKDSKFNTAWNFEEDIVAGTTTLYAKWDVNKYTVTFEPNGGSAVSPATVEEGDPVVAPLLDPVRTGYTFAGWYEDAGLTEVFDFTEAITADTTVYAKWELVDPTTYTVTFETNGGTAVTSQEIAYEGTVVKPADPGRTGYTFTGWYEDAAFTTAFDFNKVITADTVVYAKWQAPPGQYMAVFDTNGGAAVASVSVEEGETVSRPEADPTRTGYTFAGWYGDAGLTEAFDFNEAITADTMIYAKWNAEMYEITFETNGGTAVTSQKIVYEGTVVKPSEPTRAGYTFAGWYKDSEFVDVFDFALEKVTGTSTIYAKWEEVQETTYSVTFNTNGGSAVSAAVVVEGDPVVRPMPDPVKTGHTFAGWFKDAALTEAFDFTTALAADTTIYAKWDVLSYTVSFKANGGSSTAPQQVAYGHTATKPADPARSGHAFAGWYTDARLTVLYHFSEVITADTSLYAKWTVVTPPTPDPAPNPNPEPPKEPVVEEIEVDVGTGDSDTPVVKTPIQRTTEADGTVKDNVTFTPEKAQEFLTNSQDKLARIIIPDAEDSVAETTINVPSGTVGTLAGAGAALVIDTANVKISISESSMADFNDDLYFRVVPVKKEEERNEIEERAKQEEAVRDISPNAATIEVLGRPMTIETNMQNRPVTLTLPIEQALPENADERAEVLRNLVVFIEHSDGTKEVIRGRIVEFDTGELGVQFDVNKFSTFTMVYLEGANDYFAPTYEVTFDTDGGNAIAAIEVKEGETAVKPADPAKEGYVFVGWYLDVDKLQLHDFDEVVEADMTLYAKWDKVNYSVSFNSNGGSEIEEQHVDYLGRAEKPSDPVWEGYTFAGWYEDESFSVPFDFEKDIEQDTILYAKWQGAHKAYIFGFKDSTFRPDDTVTRAQMAAMLVRNLDLSYEGDGTPSYKDTKHSFAFESIELAKEEGMILGFKDGTFRPDQLVTRAQVAVISSRWVKRMCEAGSGSSLCDDSVGAASFSDVAADHWAAEAIDHVSSIGISNGFGDGSFKPEDPVTRAQAVVMLNCLFERGTPHFEEEPTFIDVPVDHWAFKQIEEAAVTHEYTVGGAEE